LRQIRLRIVQKSIKGSVSESFGVCRPFEKSWFLKK